MHNDKYLLNMVILQPQGTILGIFRFRSERNIRRLKNEYMASLISTFSAQADDPNSFKAFA